MHDETFVGDDWIADLATPVATLGAVEMAGHDRVFEYLVSIAKSGIGN